MTHIPHRCARLLALLIVPVATIACHDAYDALFLDPDRSTTARIEYLFTQGRSTTGNGTGKSTRTSPPGLKSPAPSTTCT